MWGLENFYPLSFLGLVSGILRCQEEAELIFCVNAKDFSEVKEEDTRDSYLTWEGRLFDGSQGDRCKDQGNGSSVGQREIGIHFGSNIQVGIYNQEARRRSVDGKLLKRNRGRGNDSHCIDAIEFLLKAGHSDKIWRVVSIH
jgi:hypothetical protein